MSAMETRWRAARRTTRILGGAAVLPALLVILMGAGCRGRPRTYEECLLDLGRTRSSAEAVALCLAAFPSETVPLSSTTTEGAVIRTGPLVGTWFYRADPRCGSIAFLSQLDGFRAELDPRTPGFCGSGSAIECDLERGCRLVCVRFNASTETRTYWVDTTGGSAQRRVELVSVESADTLTPVSRRRSERGGKAWTRIAWGNTLFRSLADCEEYKVSWAKLNKMLEEAKRQADTSR
jgi:hypothetical protein